MKKAIIQYLEELRYSGINEIFVTKKHTASQDICYSITGNKSELLANKRDKYKNCQKCPLWAGRKKFVYGEGNPDAICMVIGEGPGEQENLQGKPFVGPAGHLLDKMLIAIQIKREDVYIANIVKCRPPGNRNPERAERLSCLPYLLEQVEIIQPRLFLLMGLVSAQTLLGSNLPMKTLRERPHSFMDRHAYVTYHPAALLRNPHWKKDAWIDLQNFQKEYDSIRLRLQNKS